MIKENFNELISFQEKCKSFTFRCKELELFPFLRIIIGYNDDLQCGKLEGDEIGRFTKKKFKQKIGAFLYYLKKSKSWSIGPSVKFPRQYSKNKIIVFSSDAHQLATNGAHAYFNTWMSPLELCFDKIGYSYKHYKLTNNELYCGGEYVTSFTRFSWLVEIKLAWTNLVNAFGGNASTVENIEGIRELWQLLNHSKMGVTVTLGALSERVEMLNLKVNYYQRFFKESKPEIVFVYAYYADYFLPIVYAAKSLGIKVVDVQHGVIGREHFAYTHWNGIEKKQMNFIPDYFLTWDRKVTQYINDFSSEICTAVTVANLYTAYKIALQKKQVNLECMLGHGVAMKHHILVTSGSRKIPSPLLQIINNVKDVFWHIKLHPRYTDDEKLLFYHETINNINAKIYSKNEVDLYQLLELCQLHLTEESAVAIEADQLGLNTIVFSESGKDCFSNYIEEGRFIYCNCANTEAFIALLQDEHLFQKRQIGAIPTVEESAEKIEDFLIYSLKSSRTI